MFFYMENKNIYDLYRSITPPNREDILLMIDWLEDEESPLIARNRVAFEVVKRLRILSRTPQPIRFTNSSGSFWRGLGHYGGLVSNDPERKDFIARNIHRANIPSI
jgi:hypothetical protein